MKGIGPEIMRTLFHINDNDRSNKSFVTPNVSSEYNGKSSIRYFGPLVWDTMLPDSLKSIQNLEKFKTKVKKWVPKDCPCRLCKEYVAGLGFVTTFE